MGCLNADIVGSVYFKISHTFINIVIYNWRNSRANNSYHISIQALHLYFDTCKNDGHRSHSLVTLLTN